MIDDRYYFISKKKIRWQILHDLQTKLTRGFWDVANFTVCDNIDLGLILADYIAYYQIRYY